jgi:hypothetical protein
VWFKKVGILLVVAVSVLFVGCALNPVETDVRTSTSVKQTVPTANVRVLLSPETLGSIRAATTAYTVKVIVMVANPGNADQPYFKLVKEIDINTSTNSAAATFESVMAKPVIVQVVLNNASIAGSRIFHAAKDLKADQTNTIVPTAAGKGDQTDLVARVAQEFFNNSSLMASADDTLVTTIESKAASSDFDEILSSVVSQIAPSGFVNLAADTTSASTLKVGTTSKTASQYWSGTYLWTSSPQNMQVNQVLRQGLDGYGLVHWKHASDNDEVVSKISTTDASLMTYCRNYGAISQFVMLNDGSVLLAGYNNYKSSPFVLRWNPSQNASTYSTSGLSDSGLTWVNYLSDLDDDLTGASVVSLLTDYESLAYLVIKKADNSKIEYRVALDTGTRVYVPGSPEEGLSYIKQAYSDIQAVLEDNNLSDSQRTERYLAYVAEDFTSISGVADKKDELRAIMLDRFETYNINQYEFQWVSAVVINSETIEVTTKLLVDFNKKGSSTRLVVDVSPDPVIVWKRYGTDWLLKTGLPYTKNELGGF